MALKYVDETLTTGANDGTSKADAWQSLADVLDGTPTNGVLNDGDVVVVRPPVTLSYSANTSIGRTNALSGAERVDWVVDDGTVWAGASGRVTINMTGTVTIDVRGGNWFHRGWDFTTSDTSRGSTAICQLREGSAIHDSVVDISSITSSHGGRPCNIAVFGRVAGWKAKTWNRYFQTIYCSSYTFAQAVGVDIECLNPSELDGIFDSGNYASTLFVVGGSVHGDGASQNVKCINITVGTNGDVKLVGVRYPRVMVHSLNKPKHCYISGSDGRFGGDIVIDDDCIASSRRDQFYPVVGAIDPESKKWSWGILNQSTNLAMVVPAVISFPHTQGNRTLTWEMLVQSDLDKVAGKHNVVMSAAWWTPSGMKSAHTGGYGYLDSSTAVWSATTYGPSSFVPRKCELTLDNIEQNTLVLATLWVHSEAKTTDQIVIADGVPTLT